MSVVLVLLVLATGAAFGLYGAWMIRSWRRLAQTGLWHALVRSSSRPLPYVAPLLVATALALTPLFAPGLTYPAALLQVLPGIALGFLLGARKL